VSCYNAPYGSVWRLNKYGPDRIYYLLDHVGTLWPERRCLDLENGCLAGFSSKSAFDEEAVELA